MYAGITNLFPFAGNDMSRSILVFAKAKPLGNNGLDWLKIHLVNLTGMKKRSSNDDRLLFANEMMPQILDSADRPFEVFKTEISNPLMERFVIRI